MSIYGVNITNSTGVSATENANNLFVLDYLYPQGNGSKSYTLNSGEVLEVFPLYFSNFGFDPFNTDGPSYLLDTFNVTGGVLSWTTAVCTNTNPYPKFYGYTVLMVCKRGSL